MISVNIIIDHVSVNMILFMDKAQCKYDSN
uniref:Uncharacterized protein n=1 Tax=viral metagenome TaxID=1070528 RepID=A0A6C0FF92_9ZZZZ